MAPKRYAVYEPAGTGYHCCCYQLVSKSRNVAPLWPRSTAHLHRLALWLVHFWLVRLLFTWVASITIGQFYNAENGRTARNGINCGSVEDGE